MLSCEPGELTCEGASSSATVTRSEEADDYARSVAGVEIEAIRSGLGVDSTLVVGVPHDEVTVSECRIGFKMLTRATIPDGTVLAAAVESAAGGRWCERDLQTGLAALLAPGLEFTGLSQPGMRFRFAIAEIDEVAAQADRSRIRFEPPPTGQFSVIDPSPAALALGHAIRSVEQAAIDGSADAASRRRLLLETMASAFSGGEAAARASGRRIDSRHVVHQCIDYAEAIGRIPSIGELCMVSHVSQRKLRDAFAEEYDLPPSRFFRMWALEEARRRLKNHEPGETVSGVASDLGFDHLGRFSGHYRRLFGELPSATLQGAAN